MYDRMTDEAMQARVDLTHMMFAAQDADDEATLDLIGLLVIPTEQEWPEYFSESEAR